MPAYLVRYPGRQSDDILIQDDDLTIEVTGAWAVFRDRTGVALAVAAGDGVTVQRIDNEPTGNTDTDGPAPEG